MIFKVKGVDGAESIEADEYVDDNGRLKFRRTVSGGGLFSSIMSKKVVVKTFNVNAWNSVARPDAEAAVGDTSQDSGSGGGTFGG